MNPVSESPESPEMPAPVELTDLNPAAPAETTPEPITAASPEAISAVQPEPPAEPELAPPAENPPPGPAPVMPPARRRRSPFLWIVPGVLLLLILAAAGGFFWLRSYESSTLKQAQDHLQASNWGTAEAEVNQVLQYRSTGLLANPVQLVLARGIARYHLGKTDLAMADLEEGKAVDPASATPYLLQAHIQYDLGKMDKALQYAGEAQKRDDKIGFPYALQALQAFQQRDYANALPLAGKAIERDNSLDFPYFIRGVILSIHGDAQASIKDLDQALELNPNNAETLAWRAFSGFQDNKKQNALQDAAAAQSAAPTSPAGLWAQALANMINYKYDDCQSAINQAITLDSSRAEFYLMQGFCYYKTANRKDIQAAYDKAIQLAPDFVMPIYSRARSLMGQDADVDAEAEASRIQKINPQSDLAPFLLAQQVSKQEDTQKELDLVNQALTLAPDDDRVLVERGYYYNNQHQFDKASADCSKALEIWPDSSYALLCLAGVEGAQNNYDKSIEFLDKVLATNLLIPDAQGFKAKLLLLKKENDQAKTLLDAALKIDPDSPYVLKIHAEWALANKDNVQALSDLNKALENSPKDPDIFIARAYIYFDEGNTDKAAEDAQAAINLNSKLGEPYHLTYLIDMKLGKKLEALASAKKAVEVDSTSPTPFLDLGDVYLQSANYELAIKNLETALKMDPQNLQGLWMLEQAHEESGDYAAAVADIDNLLALKSQLSSTQIDSLQQKRPFFLTIPPAITGQRTLTSAESNFTITYPASWIPQPISNTIALKIVKTNDAKIITDSFGIQISAFDPNSSDALVTPTMLADYIDQSMAKASSDYKFIARKQFKAKNTSGIVDTFDTSIKDSDGNPQLVRASYYYFKASKEFIVCIFFGQQADFATTASEVDAIVATLEILK